MFLRGCSKLFHLPTLPVTIGLDSLGALTHLLSYERPMNFRDNHWDLIALAHSQIQPIRSSMLRWRHIKGHQDRDPLASLDTWAKRNILMDERANACRLASGPPASIPGYQHLWVPKTTHPVITQALALLRIHCTARPAWEYWKRQGKLGSCTVDEVAWYAIGLALEDVDPTRRRWVSKHSSGWCSVNRNMVRWGLASDHRCPRCEAPHEDAAHVWRCPGPNVSSVWDAGIAVFRAKLLQCETCPAIASAVVQHLTAWRNDTPMPPIAHRFPGFAEAVHNQSALGWDAALEGRWHRSWLPVQQRHLDFINSRRTADRWLRRVIASTWDLGFRLWTHRNEVNVERRMLEERSELELQVRQEYERGYDNLHRSAQKIFECMPLEQRLQQGNQQLSSWLFRIAQARHHATLDPITAQRHSEEFRQRQQKRLRTEAATRSLRQQQRFMANWLSQSNPSSSF